MKIKKFLWSGMLFATFGLFSFFTACDKQSEGEGKKSALRGSFTYQAVIGDMQDQLTVTTDPRTIGQLYTEYEPFCGAWDYSNGGKALFSYTVNQQLKLNADYTYVYKYSVLISNPNPWGSEIGKMTVNVGGTFSYTEQGDGVYEVEISNPVSGSQEIYGIDSNGSSYYWLWRIHDEPDFVQNFDYSDCFDGYDYTYVGARTILVNKTDKSVDDNLFIPALFNEMTKYGTY